MKNIVKNFVRIILIVFFILQLFTKDVFSFSKEDEAFLVGQKAFEDGFYEVSIGLFERFIKKYPESPNLSQAYIFIGECYFYQNNFIKALEYFQNLLDLKETENLKDVIIYWIAEVHFKEKRFTKAQESYQKIIIDYPKSIYLPFSYYMLAMSYYVQNNFEVAQKYFFEFKEKFPEHQLFEENNFKIGECLYNLKKYRQSVVYFTDFLKNSADTKKINQAYFYQAECYFYEQDYYAAIKLYEALIKDSQDDSIIALSNLGLGWSYLKIKKYKEALDIFNQIDEVLLEKQILPSFFIGKATALKENQNFIEAINNYQEAIDNNSNQKDKLTAFFGKAQSQYALKKYLDAISTYKIILDKFSPVLEQNDLEKAHYNLASIYLKINQTRIARDEFQKVIDLTYDSKLKKDCLLQIAYIHETDNDYEKAINIYRGILAEEATDKESLDYIQFKLINILIEENSFEVALKEIENFKNKFSDSKFLNEINYFLAVINFQKENYSSAKEGIEKFISQSPDSQNIIQAKYLLGLSLYNLNLYKEAINVFSDIKIKHPDSNLNSNIDYKIAECFYKLGNNDEALKKFKDFSVRYPDSEFNPNILYWLGEFYSEQEKFNLARRYYQDIIKNYNTCDLVEKAKLGMAYLDLQENFKEDAISKLNQIKNAKDLEVRRDANLLLGNLTEDCSRAILFYNAALKATNNSLKGFEILFKIADCYEREGRFDSALEGYQKIADSFKDNSSNTLFIKSLLRIAQILENKQDWQKAKEVYMRVTKISCEESEFAKEKLDWIETNINKKEN